MADSTPTGPPWWRDAVIYQIYVRSFADGDGDGIGDLPGIRSRLPYVRDLGVDAIWLNPFYPSPQVDAGYDVADYRDVDPLFGTLADFDGLLTDAHAARHPGDRRPGAQPHIGPTRLVPGRARGRAGQPGAGPLHLPGRSRPDGRPTAQQLVEQLRGPGVDQGHRGRRPAGRVVPPPVRARAARPRLDERRGAGRVRVDPALLARPGRRRVSHRRGPRPGQGSRPARSRRPADRRTGGRGPPPLGSRRGPRRLPRAGGG